MFLIENINSITVITILFIGIASLLWVLIDKEDIEENEIKEPKVDTFRPTLDFNQATDCLQQLIQKEYGFKLILDYKLNRKRNLITIEKDINEMTNNIYRGLGDGLKKELEYYYTRERLLRYIVIQLKIMVLDYLDKEKIKQTKMT